MTKAQRKRMVEFITDDGFWKSSTEDAYADAASEMFKHGMKEDVVFNILDDLYSATGGEYGN